MNFSNGLFHDNIHSSKYVINTYMYEVNNTYANGIIIHTYTGCVKSPGTTFRGCPGLESDFSKKIFYNHKKILLKSSYDYKIFFLRNYF